MQTTIHDSELVVRWLATGFLRGVERRHLQNVAERLDAAHRSCSGRSSFDAVDRELQAMTREGLFGRSVNSK